MLKNLRYEIAFKRKAFITAVGKLFNHATLVPLQNLDRLLAVMHPSHASGVVLTLQGGFILLDHLMRELYLFVV